MAAFSAVSALFGLSGKASSVFDLIGKHWKETLMALMLVVIVYQNTFETRVFFWADTIPYLREVIDEQEDAIADIVLANEQLSAAIERTNSEIEQGRLLTDQLQAQRDQLSGALANQRQFTLDQVESILNAPVPQTCQAAIGFLRGMIPNLQYDKVGKISQ